MTKFLKTASVLALVGLTFPVSAPVAAADLDEARIKELVLEAIRENPSIVREAIELLQAQEEAEQAEAARVALQGQRQLLERDPNAAVIGNPEGDVTIVEFFDYNCGYCRRVFPNVNALVAADDNVRVVMREWPILGEESVFAARASLASRAQGKYEEFHNALMASRGRITEASVMQIAGQIGLDEAQLRADMKSDEVDAHIATSQRLSQAIGFNGTPAFVFGDQLVPGAIELEQMQELVAEMRRDG